MRRLASAGRVLPAADLDLQVLEGGAETGLKKEVEHVAAVGLGVVVKQPGGGAGADCPDALESFAAVGSLQPNAYRLGGVRARHGRDDRRKNNR